jgi:hypothetical protein
MSRDLSLVHEIIGDLFKWPQTEKEWEKYKLTDEQVAFFNENGYLSHIKLLEKWQVDQLNKELEDLLDPDYPGNELFYE